MASRIPFQEKRIEWLVAEGAEGTRNARNCFRVLRVIPCLPRPASFEVNMRRVQRSEILDFVTYGEQRDAIRAAAMAEKERRRVHLGEHLTFLFENPATVRYQVLEMVRAEQMVKESDIQHELETYNA